MRELALAKLQDAGKSNVELWVDDLFSWQPDQDYDVVFFAFWLSHVPESDADRFWRSVHDALRPGGRFFLVDAARAVLERNVIHGSRMPDRESATELRRLEDGREFGFSGVRSIPTGSREIFVTTALTRALSRRASSSSTDSADVPSRTWEPMVGRAWPSRGVSDGTRTRGRRDHNPHQRVRLRRIGALRRSELLSVRLAFGRSRSS